jgi:molecular chaperone HtpG
MNRIEQKLRELNTDLFSRLQETRQSVSALLQQYSKNFLTYTDHSLNHTEEVFKIISNVLNEHEISILSDKELYVLAMAALLHDIGMCIPEEKIVDIEENNLYTIHKQKHPDKSKEDLIRDLHHELSYEFIKKEFINLKIPNEFYAEAIALVARAHRKVELIDSDIYKPKFFLENGREFVCLPYLGAILRLSDELDITNSRTPTLLTKYYLPEQERSKLEWEKHRATLLVNMDADTILITSKTDDQNVYNALKSQFAKIEEVLEYCQKVIRNIGRTGKTYSLELSKIEANIFTNISAKNIKFSVDVSNVIETLMGKSLYENDFSPIRELIQNALDSCLYKQTLDTNFNPVIEIGIFNDRIECKDNGLGMDDYIVEKYFAKLSSSFYQKEDLKTDYNPIGKFGIGVFSYFMISEYIDVETKKDGQSALKFRVDKNPDNYFYFFDDYNRCEEGTKVVLSDKVFFKENNDQLIEYIKSTFEYVEVPIIISFNEEKTTLIKGSFKTDLNEFTRRNKIHPHYLPLFTELDSNVHEFSNSNCEGALTLYPSFAKFSLSDSDLRDYNEHSLREIQVYNHGIYVKDIPSSFLSKTIGKVNLKGSTAISLNRNDFRDSEDRMIAVIEEEIILAQIYLDGVSDEKPEEKWNNFVTHILRYGHRYDFSEREDKIKKMVAEFLKRNILIVGFRNEKKFYFDYSSLVSEQEFIYTSSVSLARSISHSNTSILVVVAEKKIIKQLVDTLLADNLNYGIKSINETLFECFSKEMSGIEIVSTIRSELGTSIFGKLTDSTRIFDFINLEKSEDGNVKYSKVIFNQNYPIIDFLNIAISKKEANPDNYRFAKMFLSKVQKNCGFWGGNYISLEPFDKNKFEREMINTFQEINNFFGTTFKFQLTDLNSVSFDFGSSNLRNLLDFVD